MSFRVVVHFNPRTPCGVRPALDANASTPHKFQSTHPLRGATYARILFCSKIGISIHAPLAGCDVYATSPASRSTNFNPRTPCGVRHSRARRVRSQMQFQSTHPLRGATDAFREEYEHIRISIHAPLAGCDAGARLRTARQAHFNPRTPCGVRRCVLRDCTFTGKISIHAPLAGCDQKAVILLPAALLFQSTHPLRGATLYLVPIRGSHRQQRADSLKNKYYQFKTNNYAF